MFYMQHSKKIANIGENIALSFLERRGFSIIHRNFMVSHHEIDIIAKRGHYFYLFEVKTVDKRFNIFPEEQISKKKRKYLYRARREYSENTGILEDEIFIEFIGIILDFKNKMANIKYFLRF